MKGQGSSVQYYRAKIPVLQVLPLREAEDGMKTEQSVFSRDGHILAESGTPLNEQKLQQFENHGVRSIVVTDYQVQWIPEEEHITLGEDCEILEKKEFSEAAEDIIHDILEADSVREMRKTAQHLRRQANRADDEVGVEKLDDYIERSFELEERIEQLSEELENIDDDEAKEEIYDALQGAVSEFEETFLEISAPDSILNDTLRAVNEREEMRRELTDFISKNPEFAVEEEELEQSTESDSLSMTVSDGLADVANQFIDGEADQTPNKIIEKLKNKSEIGENAQNTLDEIQNEYKDLLAKSEEVYDRLSSEVDDPELHETIKNVLTGKQTVHKSFDSMPISDDFARKIHEVQQENQNLQKSLWNVLQDESPLNKDDLNKTISHIQDTNYSEAAEKLLKTARKSDIETQQLENNLENLKERLSKKEDTKKKLKKRVKSDVENESIRDTLLDILDENREYDAQELLEMDTDPSLLEKIGDFMEARKNDQDDLWELANEVSSGTLEQATEFDDEIKRNIDSVSDNSSVPEQFRSSDDAPSSPDESSTKKTTSPALNGRADSSETGDDEDSASESRKSGKSTKDDDSEEDTGLQEKSIHALLEEGDAMKISRRTKHDLQTVKTAQDMFSTPSEVKANQEDIIERIQDLINEVFFGETLDEDVLEDLVFSTTDLITEHDKPIKLLVDPPAGDKYILSHSTNCFLMSMLLGTHFELHDQELMDLGAASICEDLGMTEIPPAMWIRDADLSNRGYKEVTKHPDFTKNIVKHAVNGDQPITDLTHQHHEKRDGSGYPKQLTEDEQHPLTSYITVADSFTAMLETREYRSKLMPDKALNTLLQNKSEYDANILKGIIQNLGIYPNGAVVLLSDGRLSLVHQQNASKPLEPEVFMLTDSNRNKLDEPFQFDLTDDPSVSVKKVLRF